jgi:hypothetical protein
MESVSDASQWLSAKNLKKALGANIEKVFAHGILLMYGLRRPEIFLNWMTMHCSTDAKGAGRRKPGPPSDRSSHGKECLFADEQFPNWFFYP